MLLVVAPMGVLLVGALPSSCSGNLGALVLKDPYLVLALVPLVLCLLVPWPLLPPCPLCL